MDEKDTGGAAFPCQAGYDFRGERVTTTSEGMALRDYFAAKAMQALLIGEGSDESRIASDSYSIADAMLEARKL